MRTIVRNRSWLVCLLPLVAAVTLAAAAEPVAPTPVAPESACTAETPATPQADADLQATPDAVDPSTQAGGSKCCDPALEPGTGGNPLCFEGHTCCANGQWQCNNADGSPSCSAGAVCDGTCGTSGAACSSGADCCSGQCKGNHKCR